MLKVVLPRLTWWRRLAVALLLPCLIALASAATPAAASGPVYEPALEQQLFHLMNRERTARGLPPLEHDYLLHQVARIRSWDMAHRNYFSHYSPEGLSAFDLLDGLGYRSRHLGENIGYNYVDSSRSAPSAHRMFMASAPHAAQILSPRFRSAGIGQVTSPSGARYYTMLFAN